MYSLKDIKKIHQQLIAIYPHCLVLLGGSYFYGEATENSDLDFYIVSSVWEFFKHTRSKRLASEIRVQNPRLQIIFIPKICFKYGWYYVCGQDIEGRTCISKINKKIIFRNSLKLAYYHYLKYLIADTGSEKHWQIYKSAQQISFAINIISGHARADAVFSLKNLESGLNALLPEQAKVLTEIFYDRANSEWGSNNIAIGGRELRKIIDQIYNSRKSLLRFSLFNYLFYNLKFIKRLNFTFLFRNPDKWILKKITNCLASPSCNIRELSLKLDEVIFPVFIV